MTQFSLFHSEIQYYQKTQTIIISIFSIYPLRVFSKAQNDILGENIKIISIWFCNTLKKTFSLKIKSSKWLLLLLLFITLLAILLIIYIIKLSFKEILQYKILRNIIRIAKVFDQKNFKILLNKIGRIHFYFQPYRYASKKDFSMAIVLEKFVYHKNQQNMKTKNFDDLLTKEGCTRFKVYMHKDQSKPIYMKIKLISSEQQFHM